MPELKLCMAKARVKRSSEERWCSCGQEEQDWQDVATWQHVSSMPCGAKPA